MQLHVKNMARAVTKFFIKMNRIGLSYNYCTHTNSFETHQDITLKFFENASQYNLIKINAVETCSNAMNYVMNTEKKTSMNGNNIHSSKFPKQIQNFKDQLIHFYNENAEVLNEKEVFKFDKECFKILNMMNHYEMLILLRLYVTYLPRFAPSSRMYKFCINTLLQELHYENLTMQEMVQLSYYIGIMKKNGKEYMLTLLDHLQHFNTLSVFEQCIVAESAFKTATVLRESHLKCIEEMLNSHIDYLSSNHRLLAVYCKVLRHAGANKNLVTDTLDYHIINNRERFTLETAAHILQFYATMKVARSKVIERLASDALLHLAKPTIPTKLIKMKPKYLNKVLGSASILNHRFTNEQIFEIYNHIYNHKSLYLIQPRILTHISLSLCMLDYWKIEPCILDLLQECLETKAFSYIHNCERWKDKARFYLLLKCIEIEYPHVTIPNEFQINVQVGMTVSKCLKTAYNIMLDLASCLSLQDIKITCPIQGIFIPGINCRHKTLGLIHIDILEQINSLRDTETPDGLMNLKLRLLEKMGYLSILVTQNQIRNKSLAYVYIEDRINNMCKM